MISIAIVDSGNTQEGEKFDKYRDNFLIQFALCSRVLQQIYVHSTTTPICTFFLWYFLIFDNVNLLVCRALLNDLQMNIMIKGNWRGDCFVNNVLVVENPITFPPFPLASWTVISL